jgi:hypothetical protein
MKARSMSIVAFALVLGGSNAWAQQPPNPIVHVNVTLPDGQTEEVSAPESGMVSIPVKDGATIGLRPTILDSRPWSRVVVTVFNLATSTHPAEEAGSVELKTGGPATALKTPHGLKIAVTRVSPPPSPTT